MTKMKKMLSVGLAGCMAASAMMMGAGAAYEGDPRVREIMTSPETYYSEVQMINTFDADSDTAHAYVYKVSSSQATGIYTMQPKSYSSRAIHVSYTSESVNSVNIGISRSANKTSLGFREYLKHDQPAYFNKDKAAGDPYNEALDVRASSNDKEGNCFFDIWWDDAETKPSGEYEMIYT